MSTSRTQSGLIRWGAAVLALGLAGGALSVALSIFGMKSDLRSLQRIPGGDGLVTITEPGTYSVYFEAPGASADIAMPDLPRIAVMPPDGKFAPLTPVGATVTYQLFEREGRLIGEFTATRPGEYVFFVLGDLPGGLAVGEVNVGGSVGLMLLGFLGGGIAFVTGLALLILGLLNRADARRGPTSATGWLSRR